MRGILSVWPCSVNFMYSKGMLLTNEVVHHNTKIRDHLDSLMNSFSWQNVNPGQEYQD